MSVVGFDIRNYVKIAVVETTAHKPIAIQILPLLEDKIQVSDRVSIHSGHPDGERIRHLGMSLSRGNKKKQ
jgi:hypothetical protein